MLLQLPLSQCLVDADGTTILGFLTNQSFDEVRIEYNSLVGVLFTADVSCYY
jgi:hypothetical protein